MNLKLDTKRLAALIADRLRLLAVELDPLDVACAWPVFKASSFGLPPMFVKVTSPEAARRTMDLLSTVGELPFFPKPILADPLAFDDLAVLCLEWKESVRVNAEDMTEGQLGSFLDGCRQLSAALQGFRGAVSEQEEAESPSEQFDALRRYALRHRLSSMLLRPLLSIPEPERSYGARPLAIIHGDLQPKNYGFDGDRFAAVYDTDDLTRGLACEDACYAFTERMRRSELSAAARRRIIGLFLRLVAMSPWPRDEWVIAVSHARLRIAARRLDKHPDSAFVAMDIARRDRPLKALSAALKGEPC